MVRRLAQEAVVIHEHVPQFDVEILRWMFEDIYIIMSCVLDLMLLGWPCRRRRRITVMVHKLHVAPSFPHWCDDLISPCHRTLEITFLELLLGSEDEQDSEVHLGICPREHCGRL